MAILESVFIFIFGLIVGSFLNVVIYRYNTGRSLGGRSKCQSCAKVLRWYELVPVISFCRQWGKCRKCLVKISWQYPLVEILSGGLFLLVFYHFQTLGLPEWLFAFDWIIFSLLLVIVVYDARHKIIPDGMVYAFILLSGLRMWLLNTWREGLIAGLALFAFFALLWLVSRGRWMGFGDAKLAVGIGFLLGITGGISAVIFAFWSGAAFALFLLALSRFSPKGKLPRGLRYLTIKSEVPFAPFLVLGLALNFFLALNVIPTF